MVVPFLILLASVLGISVALLLPGYSDFLLLAAPCAIASLLLLLRAALMRAKRKSNWILVDGSNVMHWKDGTPQIETLQEVIAFLTARKLSPAIVFDANAGYLLAGKYQHHHAMAQHLGLTEDEVMVVPKGSPADTFLLMAARDFDAPIVTNDRYRDWADDYPEIAEPGRLIRGGFRAGELWLEGMDIQLLA